MNLKFDNVKISACDSPGKASAGLEGSISEDFSQASLREILTSGSTIEFATLG
jgi:hypothetical protein